MKHDNTMDVKTGNRNLLPKILNEFNVGVTFMVALNNNPSNKRAGINPAPTIVVNIAGAIGIFWILNIDAPCHTDPVIRQDIHGMMFGICNFALSSDGAPCCTTGCILNCYFAFCVLHFVPLTLLSDLLCQTWVNTLR